MGSAQGDGKLHPMQVLLGEDCSLVGQRPDDMQVQVV